MSSPAIAETGAFICHSKFVLLSHKGLTTPSLTELFVAIIGALFARANLSDYSLKITISLGYWACVLNGQLLYRNFCMPPSKLLVQVQLDALSVYRSFCMPQQTTSPNTACLYRNFRMPQQTTCPNTAWCSYKNFCLLQQTTCSNTA